jgi:hypothetical protein
MSEVTMSMDSAMVLAGLSPSARPVADEPPADRGEPESDADVVGVDPQVA